MNKHAFTLIELLVVITIIAVLVGLMVAGANQAIWQAKAMRTDERLVALNRALLLYGDAERFHVQVLQPSLLAAGETATGVSLFRITLGQYAQLSGPGGAGGYLLPKSGTWIDPTKSWAFPHPWGPATYPIPAAPTSTWTGAADQPPLARTLADLSPLANLALLKAATIIEKDSDWVDNRSVNSLWNDAWGNPLVCSFALFQPPRNTTATVANVLADDIFIKHAKNVYGYNRAVYVAVGAVGPSLRTPLTGDATADATAIWQQITSTCHASEWDSAAWKERPEEWKKPIRRGREQVGNRQERCFLGVPIEIR